jgi:hypothetical protein
MTWKSERRPTGAADLIAGEILLTNLNQSSILCILHISRARVV